MTQDINENVKIVEDIYRTSRHELFSYFDASSWKEMYFILSPSVVLSLICYLLRNREEQGGGGSRNLKLGSLGSCIYINSECLLLGLLEKLI